MNNQSCRHAMLSMASFFSALEKAHSKKLLQTFTFLLILCLPYVAFAQAVTGIITDYRGYWKTGSAQLNSTRPNGSHNLLAFTYNNIQYSTGVNDELLYVKGETFTAADFWCLPVGKITGVIDGNTKIGLGALHDGVSNGHSTPPPENDPVRYLTDGIKGLNIGTCVANLPVGELFFSVHTINATEIGDGKPDILVTQVADPSGDYYDRYQFTNGNGQPVGNYKDIVFTSINTIGNWVGDFYEASQHPMTLVSPYIQTNRPIRLWAADLSEFGLNSTNIGEIRNFKITLSGRSDVAFVGYNKNGMSIGVLPVKLSNFKGRETKAGVQLTWQTATEKENYHFVVERSLDGISFQSIGTVPGAGNSVANQTYQYTDLQINGGVVYYRLKQVDNNGAFTYSPVIQIKKGDGAILQAYPNPGTGFFTITHPQTSSNQRMELYNAYGALVGFKTIAAQSAQTILDLHYLPKGAYFLLWKQNGVAQSLPLTIQ